MCDLQILSSRSFCTANISNFNKVNLSNVLSLLLMSSPEILPQVLDPEDFLLNFFPINFIVLHLHDSFSVNFCMTCKV